MSSVGSLRAWSALDRHAETMRNADIRDLFAGDSSRFNDFSLSMGPVFMDYSKNLVTRETMSLLFDLAREAGVPERTEAMFRGERINITEGRSVLHVALRDFSGRSVYVDGEDVMPDVRRVYEHMLGFCERVRNGEWTGYTGKPVTDVVNIGIGGSDLGPRMVTHALQHLSDKGPRVHFVANIDPFDLERVLRGLDPEGTLFIVSSKSFTTQETMTNALSARQWLIGHLGEEAAVSRHFVAVSTNREKVSEFGIDTRNMFRFWDWVGGRYSLWSSIGLSIALAIGPERFRDLLLGAHDMDEHFRTARESRNLPLILGLLGIWYVNFQGCATQAILPYSQALEKLPDYLQQAEMESNGKSTTLQGSAPGCHTAPVIWGSPGTNGQHAFFQLLHQGTRLVPCDFIAFARDSSSNWPRQHTMLLANFFAQPEALLQGKSYAEARRELLDKGLELDQAESLAPHMVHPGGRPSTSILLRELSPYSLGALIALYEHKIFVQGTIWQINSFDQWGVELGKQLAKQVLPELEGEAAPGGRDPSTNGLIQVWRSMRGEGDAPESG